MSNSKSNNFLLTKTTLESRKETTPSYLETLRKKMKFHKFKVETIEELQNKDLLEVYFFLRQKQIKEFSFMNQALLVNSIIIPIFMVKKGTQPVLRIAIHMGNFLFLFSFILIHFLDFDFIQ